jgi:NADPH:quinone reductase-like Zn-dependent oxidoreductase
MRAIAITEYGGVPAVTELPKPEAASDRMIFRVEAAGVNPVDGAIARGAYKELMRATGVRWLEQPTVAVLAVEPRRRLTPLMVRGVGL